MATYNKLVRDKIPELINKSGKECKFVKLVTKEDIEPFLKAKLLEEVSELLSANDQNERLEELVDVMETLTAYMKFYQIDSPTLWAKQIIKANNKGTFAEFVVLQEVSDN